MLADRFTLFAAAKELTPYDEHGERSRVWHCLRTPRRDVSTIGVAVVSLICIIRMTRKVCGDGSSCPSPHDELRYGAIRLAGRLGLLGREERLQGDDALADVPELLAGEHRGELPTRRGLAEAREAWGAVAGGQEGDAPALADTLERRERLHLGELLAHLGDVIPTRRRARVRRGGGDETEGQGEGHEECE